MSSTAKSKKHGAASKQKNRKRMSVEPSDEEMVLFQKLLRGNNEEAMKAHEEYSSSQDKVKFYKDIISICHSESVEKVPPPPGITRVTEKNNKNSTGAVKRVEPITRPSAVTKVKGDVLQKSPTEEESASVTKDRIKLKTSVANKNQKDSSVVKKNAKPNEKPVCSFFSVQGSCRKGKKCRFRHPDGEFQGNRWISPCVDTKSVPYDVENENGNKDATNSDINVSSTSSVPTASAANSNSATLLSTLSVEDTNETRGNMRRTTSVDNAMGLLEMDVRYLEENLDMHLENENSAAGSLRERGEVNEQDGELLSYYDILSMTMC